MHYPATLSPVSTRLALEMEMRDVQDGLEEWALMVAHLHTPYMCDFEVLLPEAIPRPHSGPLVRLIPLP